ncbi:hypothetical protein [Gordonia sp. (in: high G+C Gram-positive bacteria)]|uniref:hypothetical protein n=1 Tax=Gordonia sp. (in: high G+C Gram-positive bacteria) TaxID=84139 RepID=UPI001DE769A5|nr:hypothetical protein [Gordonia sp. (in: high G+C Gram-positive bacteria)]MCB1293146.1 hypothetical protein [Gordonia sp. (in: high G+C Gram-positive bacteria)]HMS75042.1 hypothetical protein [Gordonia sp. (in: high G+C Gram-positive bacteria)]HQV17475.1 hypothetical protein [Gordonia sp. (in: high G+C Gram-positive bacteria)]
MDQINDIVLLMFAHTAYKAYPPQLIEKNRWDLMTKWLDKLTTYDLSGVDASRCESIDDWLDALESQSPLQLFTSSGTTGTFSFIPKDVDITVQGMKIWKLMMFQTFGKEPTEDELNPVVDAIEQVTDAVNAYTQTIGIYRQGAGDRHPHANRRKTNCKTYSCASVVEVAMRLNCPTVTQEQRKP